MITYAANARNGAATDRYAALGYSQSARITDGEAEANGVIKTPAGGEFAFTDILTGSLAMQYGGDAARRAGDSAADFVRYAGEKAARDRNEANAYERRNAVYESKRSGVDENGAALYRKKAKSGCAAKNAGDDQAKKCANGDRAAKQANVQGDKAINANEKAKGGGGSDGKTDDRNYESRGSTECGANGRAAGDDAARAYGASGIPAPNADGDARVDAVFSNRRLAGGKHDDRADNAQCKIVYDAKDGGESDIRAHGGANPKVNSETAFSGSKAADAAKNNKSAGSEPISESAFKDMMETYVGGPIRLHTVKNGSAAALWDLYREKSTNRHADALTDGNFSDDDSEAVQTAASDWPADLEKQSDNVGSNESPPTAPQYFENATDEKSGNAAYGNGGNSAAQANSTAQANSAAQTNAASQTNSAGFATAAANSVITAGASNAESGVNAGTSDELSSKAINALSSSAQTDAQTGQAYDGGVMGRNSTDDGGTSQSSKPHASERAANGEPPAFITEMRRILPREALLILNGQKYEFAMQLKPESLGKVIMRIASENGVINAKLYVDNEQARRSLETNLGELRETLSGQGLDIQGCSVEVRRENEGSRMFNELNEGRRNGANPVSRDEAGVGATMPDAGRRAFIRNWYYQQQSSVQFTA